MLAGRCVIRNIKYAPSVARNWRLQRVAAPLTRRKRQRRGKTMTIMDGFKFGLGVWFASILIGTVWVVVLMFIGLVLMS